MTKAEISDLWQRIQSQLREKGIDLAAVCGDDLDASGMKVVCMPLGLGESLEELSKSTRNQVVMVRVDEETSRALDAWVETGAVKSRSEAAALFIREGLGVRAAELEQLGDALRDVERAKDRLRERVRDVFRRDDDVEGASGR